MAISIRKKNLTAQEKLKSQETVPIQKRKEWDLKYRTFDSVVEEFFPEPRKRTVYLHPYPGEITSVEEIEKAIRSAGKNGVVECSAGEYAAVDFGRQAPLLCHDAGGHATVRGTLSVRHTTVMLKGFSVEPLAASEQALIIENGILICEDCDFRGKITLLPGSKLYMRNCGIIADGTGIEIAEQCFAEIIATRIMATSIGLHLATGSEAHIFGSRFDGCQTDAGEGMGLHAEKSDLYIEGCEFFGNDIALSIADSPRTRIFSTHFDENAALAIKATNSTLAIRTSLICTGNDSAPIFCAGGKLRIEDSHISAASQYLSAPNCQPEILDSTWEKEKGETLAIGEAKNSFTDNKPQPVADSSLIRAHTLVETIIGQEKARAEIYKILQFAWAAIQRPAGLRQRIATTFVGQPKSGQESAAICLAAALKELGVLKTDKICTINLTKLDLPISRLDDFGLFFFALPIGEKFSISREGTTELIAALQALPVDAAIVVETNDEKFRSLVSRHIELRRIFSHEVVFKELEPTDLLGYFSSLCEQEKIHVSRDAARKLLLIITTLHEGFARRYADTDGIEELFFSVRRHYLARGVSNNNEDEDLIFDDIEIPIHRRGQDLCERSAEIVQKCRNCTASTPWLPGMTEHIYCIECGIKLPSEWGVVRDSASFRRIHTRIEPEIGRNQGAVTAAARRTVTAL